MDNSISNRRFIFVIEAAQGLQVRQKKRSEIETKEEAENLASAFLMHGKATLLN